MLARLKELVAEDYQSFDWSKVANKLAKEISEEEEEEECSAAEAEPEPNDREKPPGSTTTKAQQQHDAAGQDASNREHGNYENTGEEVSEDKTKVIRNSKTNSEL